MVLQSYLLFLHLTAAENIAVPLRMWSFSTTQSLSIVGPSLAGTGEKCSWMLEIGALLNHKPGQLLGDKRQRLALGRALVRDPATFLFDEPLSNFYYELAVQSQAEAAMR